MSARTKPVHYVVHHCGTVGRCDCDAACFIASREIQRTSVQQDVTCKNCLSAIDGENRRRALRIQGASSPRAWHARVMSEFKAESMRDLLLRMRSQGHSINRTAHILGVAPQTVKTEAARHGVVFPHNVKPRGRKAPCMLHRARLVPYAGEQISMNDASRRTGLCRTTIKRRIDVLGWTPEQAVNTPAGGKPQ